MYSLNTCDHDFPLLTRVTGVPLQSNRHYSVECYSWGKAGEGRDRVRSTASGYITTTKKISVSLIQIGELREKHTFSRWTISTALRYSRTAEENRVGESERRPAELKPHPAGEGVSIRAPTGRSPDSRWRCNASLCFSSEQSMHSGHYHTLLPADQHQYQRITGRITPFIWRRYRICFLLRWNEVNNRHFTIW